MTKIYPALKLKSGEIEGLLQSERSVINATIPVFDVARPSSKTSIEKRLDNSLELLRRAHPKISKDFFLDLRDLPLESRLSNGAHPAYYLASQLAYHGYNATHCFGFDRDEAYEKALSKVIVEHPATKIALRIEQQDMKLLDTTEDLARGFLGRTGRTFQNTTIFLDLQSIHESTEDLAALVERTYLRFKKLGAPHIIFLASAMWDWSRIKSDRITEVPRRDIELWRHLRKKGLLLGYGDYGVIAPSYIDPEKLVIPSPKLRYSTSTHWLVSKGEKPKKDQNSQFPRLAQRLLKTEAFRVNDLGWGHDQIRALASYELETIGNDRAVAIDTCNHLGITTNQISYTERQIAEAEVSATVSNSEINSSQPF